MPPTVDGMRALVSSLLSSSARPPPHISLTRLLSRAAEPEVPAKSMGKGTFSRSRTTLCATAERVNAVEHGLDYHSELGSSGARAPNCRLRGGSTAAPSDSPPSLWAQQVPRAKHHATRRVNALIAAARIVAATAALD